MASQKNPPDEFYIGWQDKAPDSFHRASRRFLWGTILVLVAAAAGLVLSQKGFATSTFELGTITEHRGMLTTSPVPMLKKVDANDQLIESLLLIGFGKTGAGLTLAAIAEEQDMLLEGQQVNLKGTLIYYEGKKALELTQGVRAFVSASTVPGNYKPSIRRIGEVTLHGEILDPKCALGVMKPGYGKPHRSCAIRCVAGGIPPVMRVTNGAGAHNYCIIVGPEGEPVNEAVLPYIADQIQVCGELREEDDWLVFYTDPMQDITRIKPYWMNQDLPMCRE